MEISPDKKPAHRAAEILIADDHYEISEMVAEALIDEGYRVRIAHNGLAALNEIYAHKPDLLLLDVAMPVMSGDQVLHHLRSDRHQDLPVILMTADRSPERFRALGATQLLRKPFDIGRLLSLITAAVSGTPTHRPCTTLHYPLEREAGL